MSATPDPEALRAEREALLAAFRELVLARGFDQLKVEEVCLRAEVGRERFREHFASLEDCYLQGFEETARRFDAVVFGAYESATGGWREGLRAAGYAAAGFIEAEPDAVRFAVTSMFAAGDRAQLAREAQLQRIVDLIDAGRRQSGAPDWLPRAIAEGVLGSIYQVLVRELGRGARPARDFVPELMYVAVRPYLGHAAALEELSYPPPPRN